MNESPDFSAFSFCVSASQFRFPTENPIRGFKSGSACRRSACPFDDELSP